MSHQPERPEKNCLNCGTEVLGRYCQQCGQENIVPHQNFFHLMQHFIFDIFHFDGKFFDTLRFLLFRPGRVAREYTAGRRQHYLDPIRMYLFTSALFFLIIFSLKHVNISDNPTDGLLPRNARFELASELAQRSDSVSKNMLQQTLDTSRVVFLERPKGQPADSLVRFRGETYVFNSVIDSSRVKLRARFGGNSWIDRLVRDRSERITQKIEENGDSQMESILNSLLHRLPYVLFVSLPFFALLLKLLYIRRKNLYFSDHAVFTLYTYIFNFILLLAIFGVGWLSDQLHWKIFGWILTGLFFWGGVYLYKGMRHFYGQSRKRTLVKFVALNFLGFLMLALILIIFLIISALQF